MTALSRPAGPVAVAVGDVLPEQSMTLTVQRLVMIAAANRDFAPTHHDVAVARATGAGNPYGNMMFVMALFERTALGWAGPAARLRALRSVRMAAFNEAGLTVTCRGLVSTVDPAARLVGLELGLFAQDGTQTASGVAEVELPAGVRLG